MSEPPSRASHLAGTPTRACSSCRRRKRKCDKQVPVCSNCKWLLEQCKYDFPPSSPHLVMRASVGNHTSQGVLPWMRMQPNSITNAVRDYANSLFESPQRLEHTFQEYFSQVHPWMPFMSRQQFFRRMDGLFDASAHSLILLTCAMHLTLSVPPNVELGTSRSSNYMDVKRLIVLAETEDPPTVDLIHCRLLLAFYEVYHGATDAAYVSLGTCSRAGIVLGLDHLRRTRQDTRYRSWIELEEERRTWWAITILDRLLRLQRPNWPTAVRDPSPLDLLPIDDDEWANLAQGTSVAPAVNVSQHESGSEAQQDLVTLSTSSHVRVGYFARLAQVSHLLGLVLDSRYSPTSDEAFNAQELHRLKQITTTYADLLPKEASAADCAYYCGPISICLTAQLILEQSGSDNPLNIDTSRDTNDAIDAIVATLVEMAEDMNDELTRTPAQRLRALAIYPIFHAAQIHVQRSHMHSDARQAHGTRVLLHSLDLFAQRWRVAGVYKAAIASAINPFRAQP